MTLPSRTRFRDSGCRKMNDDRHVRPATVAGRICLKMPRFEVVHTVVINRGEQSFVGA